MIDSDALAAAREHESSGELRGAIAAYRRVSATNAEIGPIIARGDLHAALGELVAAVEAFALAERRQPEAADPKVRLAHTLTSIGRDIAAIRCLQAGIRADPDHDELRVNLADICHRTNWADVGYWAVRSLPADLPDWWARARLDSVTRFEEVRRETFALLAAVRRQRALDHEMRWRLANQLYLLGRCRTARALCRISLEATPDAFPLHDLTSRIIARQQGPAEALDYLQALPAAFHDDPGFIERAIRYLNDLGRYAEVLTLARSRPDLANAFDIRFCVAVALLWLQQGDELRAHCREWMLESPGEVLPAGVILSLEAATGKPIGETAAPARLELVQFWDSSAVPDDVRAVMDGWIALHPGIERTLFDERTARDFLRERFGMDAAGTFDQCHHAAMKADYFRIAYLYDHGGLYVDADERCLRGMETLLAASASAEIAAVRSGESFGYLHNFFLGARAGSRPLEIALSEATRAIQDASREGRRPPIWETTGPGLITRAVGSYILEQQDRPDGAIVLLPLLQYRSFVANASDLLYKRKQDANWQLS